MPLVRRIAVGLTVATGLATAALVVPAGAGPKAVEVVGTGRSVAAPAAGTPVPAAGTGPVARASGRLAVSGSVVGLYPGATLPLALTVVNGRGTPVTLLSVTTSVANASKACTKANLVVSAYTGGAVVVPADGQVVVVVQASMPHGTGDACQGAVFDLTYHGKASTR